MHPRGPARHLVGELRLASGQRRGVGHFEDRGDAAEHGRIAEALRAADTDHIIENYKGAMHGWVYPDLAIYDEAAAKKHMRRLKENLTELFAQ